MFNLRNDFEPILQSRIVTMFTKDSALTDTFRESESTRIDLFGYMFVNNHLRVPNGKLDRHFSLWETALTDTFRVPESPQTELFGCSSDALNRSHLRVPEREA